MKDRYEVLEKFTEMRNTKLKERKFQFLSKSPRNCFYNYRQRVRENGVIGFCQNQNVINNVGTKIFVCNDPETAEKCVCFKCRNTEVSVEYDFNEILKSPAKCGKEYPKLAVLIWFLQDYDSRRWIRFLRVLESICKGIFRLVSAKWW